MTYRQQDEQWWDELPQWRKSLYTWGIPVIYGVDYVLAAILLVVVVYTLPVWFQVH